LRAAADVSYALSQPGTLVAVSSVVGSFLLVHVPSALT